MRFPVKALILASAAVALATTTCAGTLRDRPLEGFGANTPGGSGGAAYSVTSLADSGPGTLRDALSASNRNITFAVGGTIALASTIRISGNHITVDASSAPPPGITITAAHSGVTSALIEVKQGNDIILRHLRITDAPDPNTGDNLRIWDGSYNVVVDHCSFRRPGDGNLDISDGAHDVTIQWCILAEAYKNSLIRTGVWNISLHHNLYVHGDERNPQLDDATSVDMVNNVIYDWAGNYGTRLRNAASANVVANAYVVGPRSDSGDAIVIYDNPGPIYIADNDLPPACEVVGTTTVRLPAPPVTEMRVDDALRAVLEEAGAAPRDSEDRDYVAIVASTPAEALSWGSIKAMFK
jgi:pectate lyase